MSAVTMQQSLVGSKSFTPARPVHSKVCDRCRQHATSASAHHLRERVLDVVLIVTCISLGSPRSIETQPEASQSKCWIHRLTRKHRKFRLRQMNPELSLIRCCSQADVRHYNQVPAVVVLVSPETNSELQIMVTSTTAFLVAGRFGLAPTVKQQATSGLRLVDNGTKGLSTGDPAGKLRQVPYAASAEDTERCLLSVFPCCVGFTAVDVLGHGTMAHVIGVGAILSLRVRLLQHPLLLLMPLNCMSLTYK